MTSDRLDPITLGLPEKFSKWRTNQEEAVNSLLHSPKRTSILNAPTGFGKSGVIIGEALASGKRTCILTATRSLADQYLSEFKDCGLADLRGRSNYQCEMREDFTCEQGRNARCPYWGSVTCPCSSAEMEFRASKLCITNYPKWLSTSKFDTPLMGFQQLIMDEGHEVPDALADSLQVTLQHREIEEKLGIPFLDGTEAEEFWNWKRWARSAHTVCCDSLKDAQANIQVSSPKPAHVKEYVHLINLRDRLFTLSCANPKEWVVEEINDVGFQYDPIRPARYAELKLFASIPRIILASATIRPKTMYMLGVAEPRFDFQEYSSDFDASRCPTYHVPTIRNDHRCEDFGPLYLAITQVMARRADRKGLIHTVSWERLHEILDCTKYSERITSPKKGELSTPIIEAFKKALPPKVLASPSISTGYDFPYIDAEYQIIPKIPFHDGRSKIVKARQEEDKDYGPYRAMQALVQTVGRIMRAKDDRGESFILDDHILWFRRKYSHFAPKTFHQFFKEILSIPAPPPKL